MERGWKAKGLIRPVWEAYGKRQGVSAARDALAKAIGASPNSLSSINSGKRRLGEDLAQRITEETGVSVFELGAPKRAAMNEEETRILDRLEALSARVGSLEQAMTRTTRSLARLAALQQTGGEQMSPQARPQERRAGHSDSDQP